MLVKRLNTERGIAHLLVLISVLGIIVFLLISNTFSFRNKLFGSFFPKPSTYAATSALTNSCNLVSNTNTYNLQSVTKPGYLQSYTDPLFNTQITRLSGDPGTAITTATGQNIGTWGADVHHEYSKAQAWNADQSLIFIETNKDNGGTGAVFLDGQTYQPVLSGANRPDSGGEMRWHPTNANLMVYVSGNTLGSWDPRQNTKSPISTFSYNSLHLGPWEGNLSLDGNRVVLSQMDSTSPAHFVFAYDIANHVKYPDIDTTQWQSGYEVDWASVSPNGDYIVLSYSNSTADGKVMVLDLNGSVITTFPYAGHPSHADMTVDGSGDEVIVGKAVGDPNGGRVIKVRLKDAATTILTAGGYARHSSARDTALKTWGVSSMEPTTNYPPYNAEIVLYNLDGSMVYRLGQHHDYYYDYESEVIPTLSPDGLRVLFASDWGSSTGRPVQVYVIDYRSNCQVTATPTPVPTPTPTTTPSPSPVPTPSPAVVPTPQPSPSPSPTPLALNIEAESMSLPPNTGAIQIYSDSTASGGQALVYYSNATAFESLTTTSQYSKLVVTAKGDQCKGAPSMKIVIDNLTIATTSVSATSWSNYSYNIYLPSGSHTISISYTNDYQRPNCDRNLRLDKFTLQ